MIAKLRPCALSVLMASLIMAGLILLLEKTHSRVAAGRAAAPTVTAVQPDSAANDLDAPVIIAGTGFTAQLSGTVVITPPRVWLGETILHDVEWISETQLNAVIPWGLEPGVYTLTVVNPDGSSTSLSQAFTMTHGIGVWTTGGPYGGNVNHLAINPITPTTVYAAVMNVGLFRSRDSGEHWELVFPDIGWVSNLALDSLSPNRIYTEKPPFGLIRSDDGGDTWISIPIPFLENQSNQRVYAHPTISGTIYATLEGNGISCALGSCGLYRSADYGQTWITATSNLTDTAITAMAFDPTDPLTMYVGTYSGNVFQSVNGGATWNPIGRAGTYIRQIALNPFRPTEVWACGAGDASGSDYIWKYTPETGSWTQIAPGTGNDNVVISLDFDETISGTIWIGADTGGFKSTDGGATWAPSGGPPYRGSVYALAIDPTDSQVVYQGYGGWGVDKTIDNGAHWQELNQGLAGIVPNNLAIRPGQPGTVFAGSNRLFKSSNGGGSWLEVPGVGGGPTIFDSVTDTRLYVGGLKGVWILENEGASWHWAELPVPPQYEACCVPLVQAIAADPVQPGQLLLGVGFLDESTPQWDLPAGAIYSSTNFGETWNYLDLGHEISPVKSLSYHPVTPSLVYASASGTVYEDPGEILISHDSGTVWGSSTAGLDSARGESSLAIEPNPPYRVFVTFSGGLWVSGDGGQTWSSANRPVTPQPTPFTQLLYVPGDPARLYIASLYGLFWSNDGAQNWHPLSGDVGRAEIWTMAAATLEERTILYISTVGGLTNDTARQTLYESPAATRFDAGVYRYTWQARHLYLPLLRR